MILFNQLSQIWMSLWLKVPKNDHDGGIDNIACLIVIPSENICFNVICMLKAQQKDINENNSYQKWLGQWVFNMIWIKLEICHSREERLPVGFVLKYSMLQNEASLSVLMSQAVVKLDVCNIVNFLRTFCYVTQFCWLIYLHHILCFESQWGREMKTVILALQAGQRQSYQRSRVVTETHVVWINSSEMLPSSINWYVALSVWGRCSCLVTVSGWLAPVGDSWGTPSRKQSPVCV